MVLASKLKAMGCWSPGLTPSVEISSWALEVDQMTPVQVEYCRVNVEAFKVPEVPLSPGAVHVKTISPGVVVLRH